MCPATIDQPKTHTYTHTHTHRSSCTMVPKPDRRVGVTVRIYLTSLLKYQWTCRHVAADVLSWQQCTYIYIYIYIYELFTF